MNRKELIKNKTGETKYNKHGSKMAILEYRKYNDITVVFENGYSVKTTYSEFKKGKIKSPYDKTVWGVGYLGVGEHKASINCKHTLEYATWKAMLKRCYDNKIKEEEPTYKDVICCEQWLNFQKFASWYKKNYYKIDGERMELDKDILSKGNKIYSPETCLIVPKTINLLFVKGDKRRGEYPIGVGKSKIKATKQYISQGMFNNKKYAKYYDTVEEAFNSYKEMKEIYIKKVADMYKSRIPQKLYHAMYSYKVEITD